jgi:histidine triad (HIT) family protein
MSSTYDPNNIFARILRGEIPCHKVYEDDRVLAFHDVNPKAPVHILVIPKKPVAMLADLTGADTDLMGYLVVKATEIAKAQGLAESGYRFVCNCGDAGGQTVNHIHLHLLGGRPMGWPPG